MKLITLLPFLFVFCGSVYSQDLVMWYDKPAVKWEETLPLGNGQIGMMPDGGVQSENIVLNEISLWSGGEQDPNNYEAYKSVKTIQQLLFEGKNNEAERLVNQNFVCTGAGSGYGNGATVPYGCFQNFGFLNFQHFVEGEAKDYVSKLDLENSI
jgi:alpha-L-fucosidase 2